MESELALKLKHLKVYSQAKRNYRTLNRRPYTSKEFNEYCSRPNSMLAGMFSWDKSKEGYDFWNDIDRRLDELVVVTTRTVKES